MFAVAKYGWVVPRYQSDQKRANFQLKKLWTRDFISQWKLSRYHLISNLVLNKVSVTLYVNNK